VRAADDFTIVTAGFDFETVSSRRRTALGSLIDDEPDG
jgi:hypothetical protein